MTRASVRRTTASFKSGWGTYGVAERSLPSAVAQDYPNVHLGFIFVASFTELNPSALAA